MKKHFMVCIICLHFSCSWLLAAPFFSDGFESGDLSHVDSVSGAAWTASDAAPADSVTVSNERAHSGNYALKFFFAGNPDLADDAWAEQRFSFGQTYDEVYIRFYIYYPSNYTLRETGGAENTKLMYLWGDDYADMHKIGIEYEMDLKFGFKAKVRGWPDFSPSCSGNTGYVRAYPKASTSISDLKGRWAAIEVHSRRDTGVGDGVFQLWIDGNLEIDAQNIAWEGAPCAPNEFFRNGYLLGWSNAGFDQDTTVFIDDVVFSTSYIGLLEGQLPSRPAAPQGFSRNE